MTYNVTIHLAIIVVCVRRYMYVTMPTMVSMMHMYATNASVCSFVKCFCPPWSCTCTLPAAIICGPAPDAPANGQRSGSGRAFRSTVTYTCNRGYTLLGSSSVTCMANRQWSGRAPICNCKLLCKHMFRYRHMDIKCHKCPSGECSYSVRTVGSVCLLYSLCAKL